MAEKNDSVGDKLASILPAEGTAALLAVNGLIPDRNSDDAFWAEVAAGVVAIFVILWAIRVRKVDSIWQLAFLLVGYAIWATGILWGRLTLKYDDLSDYRWAPAATAVLFTLFIYFVFPAKPAK